MQIGLIEIDLKGESLSLNDFIVQEHMKLRNTISGTASSHKIAYNGTQVMVSLEDGLQALKDAVVRARQGGAGFIVGHSLRSTDMVWLQSAGVNLDGLSVMDVAGVEKAFLPTHGIEFCGEPHVAGNDAAVTALVIASLLELLSKCDLSWVRKAPQG